MNKWLYWYVFLGEIDDVELKIVIVNELKKELITNEHAQYKAFYNDHIEPWRGWPDSISTVCRDVACQVSEQIAAYTSKYNVIFLSNKIS